MVTSQNGRKVRSVSNSTYTMLVYLMKNHVHSFSNQQCPMNNASNAMWTWINTQLSLAKCLTSFSSLFWYYSPKPTFSSVQSLPLLRLWVIHSSPINEQNVEKAVKKRSTFDRTHGDVFKLILFAFQQLKTQKYVFYHDVKQKGKQPKWSGNCWTAVLL